MFAPETYITVNGRTLRTMEKIYDDNTIAVAISDTNDDLLWWKNGSKKYATKEDAAQAIRKELNGWAKLQVLD